MNATRTTLSDVLWRWRRGIARALLVMGALAGMTLGTVAQAQIVARTPAQSAGQVAPPSPTFQLAGTAVSGTGSVTPAWPAHAIDDIALLFVESTGGEPATLSTPAGFVAVLNSPQATGLTTAGTQITVFWARATSTSMASPVVADPGDHVYAQILTYRGVFASGNPWDVTGGGVKAAASTSVTVTGVTTNVANTLVVQAVARDNDSSAAAFSAQTNVNLTGIAERSDAGTTSSNGGGFAVWDGVKAAAGATGDTTATVTSSINAFLTVALRPTTSALTITKPAGTIQNDVMVASIGFRSNSPGLNSTDVLITAPAGWTLAPVGRVDNLNSTSSALAVYTRVAGAGEPANYTWGVTCIATCATNGFNAAAGGIVSFSGVENTAPVDVGNGAPTTVATTTPATPDVTTTVANTMLVTAHAIANANTWQIAPPSGMTEAFQVISGAEMIQVSTALQAAAGATGTKTAMDLGPDVADFGNAHILALQPALPVFNQSAYRLFNNADSTNVGTALTAAQDTAATLPPSTGAAFRLRMLVHVSNANLAISGQAFKLQFAARSGTCDTAFSGETYADVTAATVIAYNNNATPADGATLTANASDPTHGADTVVNQTYEELNNFTNSVAAINIGQDGKWDFALRDNGSPANTTYCFRMVRDTGAVLNTYTVIPEITIATRGTVFYFHDATTPNIGTLPAATTLSATTPNVTAATAGTNRDMNQTLGTAQVSQALTTLGQTGLQRNWFRRFLSRPLAAQTLPTGVWAIQAGASESNAASNMLPLGAVIKVWRPSTGATVATLLDDPVLGTVEPGTTETNVSQLTAPITGVAVNDGDILVVELWAENTQGDTTARTNTIFYDGTTEASITTNAAFLQAPGAITFYRGIFQTAYRLFNNADSTDVGTALAAQDTAATLGATGAAFRLRMLLHVADINLGLSGQAFKLQFAARSGACDTAFSGETYADVTAATVIAYNNNATPADGDNLTNNANDPTHSGHTLRNQDYEELNNFTNTVAAINSGEDGKWDFALKDNGAPASTTYCFRVVKDTGTVLDNYTVIPEITTAPPAPVAGGFNAYETSTAAGAITGVIMTKRAGSTISLDIIALNVAKTAIETTFTGTVRVEVLNAADNSGALDGNSCRPSWTVIQTLSPDPVIVANGRLTISFTQANSYPNVRLRITFPAGAPTVTGCSNDNFAIRPDTLASFAVTDTDWQTTGAPGARALNLLTFAATTPLHKAGRPFSVRATAVNTAAATTGNYTGAPTATLSTCVGAACTATFGTLTLTTTFVAGQLASDVASYNDVGSFALRLEDQTFASVDAADTAGDCTATGRYVCSATLSVGRFVPDHFAVALNAPVFGSACGSFTYIGQAFGYAVAPVITVTAQGFANNTTTLYNTIGSWWRITSASLTGKAYTAAVGGTPDTSGLPGTDPVIVSSGLGVGTLTFGSGTGLFFTRTTPVAPFDADISLAINVIDADGVILATNPARFGTATAGNGIGFSAGKPMRFGRLAIRNANGSQLVPLPVPLETQYWNGTAFITNTGDNCTSIVAANVGLGNYTGNLNSPETTPTISGAFSSGRKNIVMSAPGAANNGSVDIVVNLGTTTTIDSCLTWGTTPTPTGANLSHLRGQWCGATYTKDPTARAAFGVFKGAEEVIFQRENF